MSTVLTRRHFLRYSGAAVGSLAYAGALGPLAEAFPPFAPASLELSPRRQATLAAIVEAVGSVVPRVDAARADEVVAAVSDRYRAENPDMRLNLELMLDSVEADLEAGEFKRLRPSERVRVLEGRGLPGRTVELCSSSTLVEGAVALAAAHFYTPEDDWTPHRFARR